MKTKKIVAAFTNDKFAALSILTKWSFEELKDKSLKRVLF